MPSRKYVEARRRQRGKHQTPAERYADLVKDIGQLVACLETEVQEHAKRAAERPDTWDHAGQLSCTRQTLKDALQALLVWKHEWSGIEASRFIEDYLEEMRSSQS